VIRRFSSPPLRCLRRAAVAGLLWLLGACANTLEMTVAATVPQPVVTPLPVTMGVYYSEDFRTRVFLEDTEDRENWRIDTLEARLSLFDEVMPQMFENVREVPEPPAASELAVDAILAPEFEEMQVALPDETRTDFYEAWIKYRIRLLEPEGDLIASWNVSGYGKQDKAGIFTSRESNLNAAIEHALRDIGAKLSLGFRHRQDVRRWFCSRPDPPPALCVQRQN